MRSPTPPRKTETQAQLTLRQFRVIFQAVKRHFGEVERRCGIGGAQLWALAAVDGHPGIRVTELAAALSVHQSTASNLVEQLVRAGLVERQRDPADGRVVQLIATAAGRRCLRKAPVPITGVLPDALARMDPKALAQLHDALGLLLDVLAVRDDRARDTPLADL